VTRVPDEDLQLLEAYLDDELSADEVEALRDRLIDEPDMATTLAEMREARSTRQKVFASMEPGELTVSDAVADVQHAIRGRVRWGGRLREGMRYVAAAACVVLGVMIGTRVNRPTTGNGVMPVAGAGGPTNLYVTQRPPQQPSSNVAYVANEGDTTTISWPVVPTAQRTSLRPTLPVATPRVVVLTDERGTIIAAQQFETVAEAREFVEDLRRAAEASGHAILPMGQSTVTGLVPAPGPAPVAPVNTAPVMPVVAEQF
jgi:anti-sigma factor RsiW